MTLDGRLGSSFRDPSGFVFQQGDHIYRKVAISYGPTFDALTASGLLARLVDRGLLVPFEVLEASHFGFEDARAVLAPERIQLVSYPYEWCFGQLKDAALATLDIQGEALSDGFVLKDASAFNVQFHRGKPVFIDTLSFEKYVEGEPWIAYRQFCQHFLAPLALMAYVDPRLVSLFRTNLDGIPLDLAAKMMPSRARLKLGISAHLLMHSRANQEQRGRLATERRVSKIALLALIDSLRKTVAGLDWVPQGTEWANYYSDTNYNSVAESSKREIVQAFLDGISEPISTCWDLGANNGEYSRIAIKGGLRTVAWDIDHAAVEQAYRWSKREGSEFIQPLVQDLTNPTPSIGWNLNERDSLISRGPADVAMGLALIHHLAIGNNVPLDCIAEFLSRVCRWIIIEFVPKEDSQVQRMLVARQDIFGDYDLEGFESAFSTKFSIIKKQPVEDSMRTIFLLRRID